jgi:hypothetical protein
MELSLGRTFDESLFFVNRLNDLLFLIKDKEGMGEMEEDLVENLGKHRIGR